MGSSWRFVAVVGLLGGCGSTTTNAGPGQCGDAIVQPPEACDDGNLDEGDGCNSDCRRSGRRQWCFDPSSPTGTSIRPLALVGFDGGVVALVEITDELAASHEPRLIALDTRGVELWSRALDVPGLRGRDLALGPSGTTAVVVALVSGDAHERAEAWFGEFDLARGEPVRERRHGDPDGSLRPLAIAPIESALLVAGSVGADDWLARLGPNLDLEWARRFDRDDALLREARVVPLDDGRIAVAGSSVDPKLDGEFATRIFVHVHDRSGALERDVSPAGPTSTQLELIDAIAWDAGVLVGASQGQVFPRSRLWAITDAGVDDLWDSADSDHIVHALARTDSGVFAAGSKDQPFGPGARWLARLGPDLRATKPVWERIGPPGELVALAPASAEPSLYAGVLVPRPSGGGDTQLCKFSE